MLENIPAFKQFLSTTSQNQNAFSVPKTSFRLRTSQYDLNLQSSRPTGFLLYTLGLRYVFFAVQHQLLCFHFIAFSCMFPFPIELAKQKAKITNKMK